MSLPHVLLVDDSEAILEYEQAALGGSYQLSLASNGKQALGKIRAHAPAVVLLDLSMPVMGGDELLELLQQDAELKKIPVIIVSSEVQRSAHLLTRGAVAFLPKPLQAASLCAAVAQALSDARARARTGSLLALLVGIGGRRVGLPLEMVREVVFQPAMIRLAASVSYLTDAVQFHGAPLIVLDLARALKVKHAAAMVDRKLVIVEHDGLRLALSVDAVEDPVEVSPAEVFWREALIGLNTLLDPAVRAVVSSQGALVPIIEPHALWSRKALRRLDVTLSQVPRLAPQAQVGQ